MLAVLLPSEDLQNRCLRALVGEILAEMIIGNVLSSRLCEPWALWELIAQLLEPFRTGGAAVEPEAGVSKSRKRNMDGKPQEAKDAGASAKSNSTSGTNRLEQFGLLNSRAQTSRLTDETAGLMTGERKAAQGFRRRYSFASTFWQLVNYGLLAITAVRAVVLTLLSAGKLPHRTANTGSATTPPLTTTSPADDKSWSQDPKAPMPAGGQNQHGQQPRAIILMAAWRTVSNLIELPARMPWLYGMLCLAQRTVVAGPGRLGDTDGMLDR